VLLIKIAISAVSAAGLLLSMANGGKVGSTGEMETYRDLVASGGGDLSVHMQDRAELTRSFNRFNYLGMVLFVLSAAVPWFFSDMRTLLLYGGVALVLAIVIHVVSRIKLKAWEDQPGPFSAEDQV
jgi:hypothetical protein